MPITPQQREINKKQVEEILRSKGYSGAGLAAIMSNIDVQTGGKFDHQQQQYKGPGYGLFQFDSQNKYYQKYREAKGLKDSKQSQIMYMGDAINNVDNRKIFGQKIPNPIGSGNASKIRNAFKSGDSSVATKSFMNHFQKPNKDKSHQDRRVQSANNFFKSYQNGKSSSSGKENTASSLQSYFSDNKKSNLNDITNLLSGKNKGIGGVDLSFDLTKTYFDGFYSGSKFIYLHKGQATDSLMKDMIVPLKIMYDENIKNKNISVSIQPNIPTQPDGQQMKKIYYPKELEGTYYGQIMIEADWIMKKLKIGIDQNKKAFVYPQSLKKVGLQFQQLIKLREAKFHERTRQWIVIKKVQVLKNQRNKTIIGKIKMGVESKSQVLNQKGILTDSQQKASEYTKRFCQLFTLHYDLIAKQYPQFQVLKRLAKASVLSRSMYEHGIQINYELINQLYEREKTDTSSNKLKTLYHDYIDNNLNQKLSLIGGCDLTFSVSQVKPIQQKYQEDGMSTDEQLQQYQHFAFQSAISCKQKGCQRICRPDYYSVKNRQCMYHSKMLCTLCYKLIQVKQKYNKANDKCYHSQCFICTQCQSPIQDKFVEKQQQFYHQKCAPKTVLGKCLFCKDEVFDCVPYLKNEIVLVHKSCMQNQKCTLCSKPIENQQVKFINDKIYHKNCMNCYICRKNVEGELVFNEKGIAHCDCIPKMLCVQCKMQIKGQYIPVNDKTYHLECLKCKKCNNVIEPLKGIKIDKQLNLYHSDCI